LFEEHYFLLELLVNRLRYTHRRLGLDLLLFIFPRFLALLDFFLLRLRLRLSLLEWGGLSIFDEDDLLVSVDHAAPDAHHLEELAVLRQCFQLSLPPIDVRVKQHNLFAAKTHERLELKVFLVFGEGRKDN
jgi:hypothetical protein